jgi:hypothetical protein
MSSEVVMPRAASSGSTTCATSRGSGMAKWTCAAAQSVARPSPMASAPTAVLTPMWVKNERSCGVEIEIVVPVKPWPMRMPSNATP